MSRRELHRTISTLPSQPAAHRIFSACTQGIKHLFLDRNQDELSRISVCFSTAVSRWLTSDTAFILNMIITQLAASPQQVNRLFQQPYIRLSQGETRLLRDCIQQTKNAMQTQQTPDWATPQDTLPDPRRPIR